MENLVTLAKPVGKKKKIQAVPVDDGTPQFAALSELELDEFLVKHGIEIPNWRELDLNGKRKMLAGMFGQVVLSVPSSVFSDTAQQATPQTFAEVVEEIEAIATETEAIAAITVLRDSKDLSDIRTGGVLAKIKDRGWHSSVDFYEFVRESFSIERSKAQGLMQIYTTLVNLGPIDWAQFEGLGWSKLRLIASLLTFDNIGDVLHDIQGMNLFQVAQYAKKKKSQCGDDLLTVRMTFLMSEDQAEVVRNAIAKAKETSHTEVDSAALELVCLGFLSGGVMAVPSLRDAMIAYRDADPDPMKTASEMVQIAKEVWPDLLSGEPQ